MIIGYLNNVPQKITIKRPCQGYYLRWYYNGFHYFFFKPGQQSLITEGEKYRTIGTKSVLMGSGQITYEQCEAIRTILNTREVYILTSDGWKNISIAPGSLVVYDNQVNGYEVELSVKIGSKEISQTGFSPILTIPIVIPPVTSPDTITVTTIIDGVFTIVVTGEAGAEIIIDWGDGNVETIVLTGGEQTITHDYTGSGGVETVITITGDLPQVTDLGLSGNDIIDIILAEDLVILETLDLSNNNIDHLDIPDTLVDLIDLDISDNQFTELPVIPDTVPIVTIEADGNPLAICEVQIGTQVWMCKNYGSSFPGSKVYNNDEANRVLYGGLYTRNQVQTAGFCPTGYHVPTREDWDELIAFCGGLTIAGGILKSIGTTYWNTGGTNNFGFDARGAGMFSSAFVQLKDNTKFWIGGHIIVGEGNTVAFDLTDQIQMITQITSYFQSVRLIRNWAALIPPVTYNDWFLSSKDELNAMYDELKVHSVGGFVTDGSYYWSSSESFASFAWAIRFSDRYNDDFNTKTGHNRVRACRAFTSLINYNLRDIGPAGGLIFWKSGNDYLEAAPSDFLVSSSWSNIDSVAVTGTGTAIGTGQANTTAIINQVGHTASAAKLCDDLVIIH
jgi:uncharacterized protein (TIGR02145 family)